MKRRTKGHLLPSSIAFNSFRRFEYYEANANCDAVIIESVRAAPSKYRRMLFLTSLPPRSEIRSWKLADNRVPTCTFRYRVNRVLIVGIYRFNYPGRSPEKVRSIGAFLPGVPAIRLILPDGTLEHAVGPLFVQGKFQMEFKLMLEVRIF